MKKVVADGKMGGSVSWVYFDWFLFAIRDLMSLFGICLFNEHL